MSVVGGGGRWGGSEQLEGNGKGSSPFIHGRLAQEFPLLLASRQQNNALRLFRCSFGLHDIRAAFVDYSSWILAELSGTVIGSVGVNEWPCRPLVIRMLELVIVFF